MSRYDGLIIPRSYSEYINKTDAATLSQALQLGGVLAQQVAAGNYAAVTSAAVDAALYNLGSIRYATTRSNTNIDELLASMSNKTYFQLFDANSEGTSPEGISAGIVQTIVWALDTYAIQIFSEMNTGKRRYIRYKSGTTWSEWEKILVTNDLAEQVITIKSDVSANSCIPSKSQREATFVGNYTDAPTTARAEIHCTQTLVSGTNERQFHQTLTSYKNSGGEYVSRKYTRFGYRTSDTGAITWGSWDTLLAVKEKVINLGDLTVTANNFLNLAIGLPEGKKVINAITTYWSSNTGGFSLMPYDNGCYLVANNGVQVKGLRVKVFYI